MSTQERRAAYGALWLLALAFGWIEASAVVYLREIQARELWPSAARALEDLQVTLASLPAHLVALEMAREACTLLLLAAAGWLAGRRPADRVGAFLLCFGIWDLTYYAVLRLILGWPESLGAWDVLFLIPAPWVAPVWAPATVATLFVVAGSYVFWTPGRERQYRLTDLGVLSAAVMLTLAAFLFGSQAAIDHRWPERFPVWLFWSGVILAAAWFVHAERAVRRRAAPWAGMRVRQIRP